MKTAMLQRAAVAALLAGAPGQAVPSTRLDIPMSTRAAPIEKVDAEKRTVTLCWTTGAQVMRYDWWEGKRFLEELSLDDGAVDLSRLNDGAPLLNSHGVYDLSAQIGVVERAWIDGGKGFAEVRFPKEGLSDDADRIFAMVSDGIIRNVSVGYRVDKYQITDNQGDGLDIWRAVSWMPMEISLVTVPADAGAGVRSEQPMHACDFIGRSMPATHTKTETEEMKTTENATTDDATRAAATQTAINDAITAERTRCTEIRKRVAAVSLPSEVADKAIERGTTVEHIGNFILDELAERGQKASLPAGQGARTTPESIEARRTAVSGAFLHRYNPADFKLDGDAVHFRGMTVLEVARSVLEADGVDTRGMNKMDLAARALHTTSDFPNILAAVSGKTLQKGYAAEQRTFALFALRNDAIDFKSKSSLILGEGPSLDKVNEKGEFTRGTMAEGKEAWALATYGKVIGVTRQALINDDLGAFTRIPFMLGAAGVRLENDTVWGILIANAALADSVALCHATHKNLGSGTAFGIDSLGAMRKRFRQQKGLDGKQTLNLEMKTVAVCSALETKAEQLLTTLIAATQASNAVPTALRSLQMVTEPRLDAISDTVHFGFTDPAQQESIEYGYLSGQEGVYLEQRIGFDVDGIEIKARHDFGAKAVNFRGVQREAGA